MDYWFFKEELILNWFINFFNPVLVFLHAQYKGCEEPLVSLKFPCEIAQSLFPAAMTTAETQLFSSPFNFDEGKCLQIRAPSLLLFLSIYQIMSFPFSHMRDVRIPAPVRT